MNKYILKFLFSFLLILCIWSFCIEPNLLSINRITLKNSDLKGIKIAIAADFHLKKHEENRLKKVIQKINENKPDLIFLVGDFVQGLSEIQSLSFEKIADNLKNLTPKYGTYAVIGNHDIWLDEYKVADVLKSAGIIVLNNENQKAEIKEKSLTIAGTNDFTENKADIVKTLINAEKPIILLTHNPDIFPFVPASVDLTISGHTHGGQVIIPFVGAPIVPSSYGNKYLKGLVTENNKQILITKGIGTSILPIRFNCLPEIIILSFE